MFKERLLDSLTLKANTAPKAMLKITQFPKLKKRNKYKINKDVDTEKLTLYLTSPQNRQVLSLFEQEVKRLLRNFRTLVSSSASSVKYGTSNCFIRSSQRQHETASGLRLLVIVVMKHNFGGIKFHVHQ